jgi:hypothetical protein
MRQQVTGKPPSGAGGIEASKEHSEHMAAKVEKPGAASADASYLGSVVGASRRYGCFERSLSSGDMLGLQRVLLKHGDSKQIARQLRSPEGAWVMELVAAILVTKFWQLFGRLEEGFERVFTGLVQLPKTALASISRLLIRAGNAIKWRKDSAAEKKGQGGCIRRPGFKQDGPPSSCQTTSRGWDNHQKRHSKLQWKLQKVLPYKWFCWCLRSGWQGLCAISGLLRAIATQEGGKKGR